MDKIIVIPINLFRFEQEILIVDDNSTTKFASVDLTSLPEVAVEACGVHGISDIKLIGNVNYAQAIANEIQEYKLQNYSNKKINVSIVEA